MSRWFSSLVAIFVVFHVTASVVEAIPNPSPGMDRRAWKEPRVRKELAVWARRFDMPERAFEDRLWSIATSFVAVRRAIVSPFQPYLKATGVRQSWAMFIAGTQHRDRFQIRARTCALADHGCDWMPLYTRSVPEEDWHRDQLEHPRLRSASFRWIWPDHKRRYRKSCDALAQIAFAEKPNLVAVQCRFERSLSPSPRRDEHRRADSREEKSTWGNEVVVEKAS